MTWTPLRRATFALAAVTLLSAALPLPMHAAASDPTGGASTLSSGSSSASSGLGSPSPGEPYRPLPGYRPEFVTETDTRPPFKDCLWAVGAMLLDKWTAGEVLVSRQRLRRLSGDRKDGSTLVDLARAYRRLGLTLRYSPDGGEYVTWKTLLRRLADGGGVVILGDYGKLPRRYARWDLAFWRKEGADDNHALYLDAYDAKRHRVRVMDPLARGAWQGEWVPVAVLRAFAWRTGGGGLWAALTPKAERAPFDGVTLGDPTVAVASSAGTVDWPMTAQPAGWKLPGSDLRVEIAPLESGIVPADEDVFAVPRPAPAVGLALPSDDAVGVAGSGTRVAALAAPGPASPTLTALSDVLRAQFAVPTEPGVYRVRLRLAERRFGRTVAVAGPFTLFVPGERHASIVAGAANGAVVAGEQLLVGASVTNDGTTTWADPARESGVPAAAAPRLSTAIWAHWLPADDDTAEAAGASAGGVASEGSGGPDGSGVFDAARVQPVSLAPGQARVFGLSVEVPSTPGAWMLVLDVADDLGGSFAAGGSIPGSIRVTVVAPPPALGMLRH